MRIRISVGVKYIECHKIEIENHQQGAGSNNVKTANCPRLIIQNLSQNAQTPREMHPIPSLMPRSLLTTPPNHDTHLVPLFNRIAINPANANEMVAVPLMNRDPTTVACC